MYRTFFCAAGSVLMLGFLFPGAALGAPEVTGVTASEDNVGNENESTLTIYGSGFGDKEHGSAVLHDFATHDYERGVLNDLHSSLGDLAEIPSGQDVGEGNARWGDTGGTGVHMVRNREKRHDGSDGHYYGHRGGSRLSWPVAHGGRQNRDEWAGDRHIYYAFWLRTWHNVAYRWRIETSSKVFREFNYTVADRRDVAPGRNPQEGEAITVGDQKGVLVGVEEGTDIDVVTLAIPGNHNANRLRGETITGLDSGATAVFPDSRNDDPGYTEPRISTSRVWQTPSRSGYSSYSWGRSGPSPVSSSDNVRPLMSGGEWHLYEWEMTLAEETEDIEIVARLDGKEIARGAPTPRLDYKNWDPTFGGPTIAQVGPNIGGNLNYWEIDEIYLDNSRQRVVLADAETLTEASRYEIQTPVTWRDDEIKVLLNYGTLSSDNELFVFVFDETGTPSEKGKRLCSNDCSARPEAPRTLEFSQTAR
ncbi:hypothetical protein HC341_16025 [Aquisalimonas sp. 2447]|uniref:hypothetical protein n=1 Tax=Aquisalimonas sp. 2447 TaxID=2740807 RepID=UPI0014324683|nr:hypothetical protein [Aquisalimonas sp. 2447]QIT56568.1 hypothetical protein HC341_16025 [Aquisalimonas sp. 2447]